MRIKVIDLVYIKVKLKLSNLDSIKVFVWDD